MNAFSMEVNHPDVKDSLWYGIKQSNCMLACAGDDFWLVVDSNIAPVINVEGVIITMTRLNQIVKFFK